MVIVSKKCNNGSIKEMKNSYRQRTFATKHQKLATKDKKSKSLLTWISVFVIAGSVAGGAYYYFFVYRKSQKNKVQISTNQVINQNVITAKPKTGQLKTFSGQEFRNLYNSYNYPNTKYIADDSIITGDSEVDRHIQKIAEARGYIRRHAPVSNNFIKVQEPDMFLQRLAAEDWKSLKQSAENDSIHLSLTAAFRDAKTQRDIFLSRVPGQILNNKTGVASGKFDTEISQILATTAIPGYSRHHTGYTVDIRCDNQPDMLFENSVCFNWLEKDNYKNAKLSGWIPSYPEGAGQQGPEPESWEYVWTGRDALTD